MSSFIKLQEKSILHVPLDKYEQNFTFYINGKEYKTNRLIADMLSPKISKYHKIDPTINEYKIDTKARGDFNKIINLCKFEKEEITKNEIPFLLEIIEKLESTKEFIQIKIESQQKEKINSIEKAINLLQEHQKHQQFYSDEIEKEIEYISTNFSEIFKEEQKRIEIQNQMKMIDYEILERIISHSNLQLDKEDDLIDIINELYLNDNKYVNLYSYVYFNNITTSKMKEFLEIFEYNDITREIWNCFSNRLSQEIIKPKSKEHKNRYKNQEKKSEKVSTNKPPIEIYYSNQKFDGIINYLRKQSSIKNEINISYSSKRSSSDTFRIFDYDEEGHYFYTKSDSNPWLCIEFKNHKIKPTNYTIRSGNGSDNPRNFIFEGSNDNNSWIKLDEQKDCEFLKDSYSVHTFSVKNSDQQSFKYLRIRLTGINWSGISRLQFSEIEIYGEIF